MRQSVRCKNKTETTFQVVWKECFKLCPPDWSITKNCNNLQSTLKEMRLEGRGGNDNFYKIYLCPQDHFVMMMATLICCLRHKEETHRGGVVAIFFIFTIFPVEHLGGGVWEEGGGKINRGREQLERNNKVQVITSLGERARAAEETYFKLLFVIFDSRGSQAFRI